MAPGLPWARHIQCSPPPPLPLRAVATTKCTGTSDSVSALLGIDRGLVLASDQGGRAWRLPLVGSGSTQSRSGAAGRPLRGVTTPE